MAEHASPDPPQQWVELVDPAAKATAGDADGNEQAESAQHEQAEAGTELAGKYSTVSMVVRQQEADAAEINEAFALRFACQAVHTLTEAVALAVASKQWVRMEWICCSVALCDNGLCVGTGSAGSIETSGQCGVIGPAPLSTLSCFLPGRVHRFMSYC